MTMLLYTGMKTSILSKLFFFSLLRYKITTLTHSSLEVTDEMRF